MITKVKLKNWRSHLDTELNFSEGTNALIGIMGSGKTSVLDAMCFALFGTFPNLNSKKTKIEDIIMKKPSTMQDAEVTVWFEADGGEWSVRRTISKVKATSAELKNNGKLIEGPQPSRVNETLQKLLKIDYDLFTRAIYSEQNAIDMFLTIPKGSRMKKIDELLAIDRFEKARATATSVLNRVNVSFSEKQSFISTLESDSSVAGYHQMKIELQNATKEKQQAEQKLSDQMRYKTALERDLEDMRKKYEKFVSIHQDLATKTALITQLENDVESLKRDNVTAEEIAYAEYTDSQLREELSKVESDENMLKANLSSENKRLLDLQGMMSSKKTKMDSLLSEKIPMLEKQTKDSKDLEKELKKNSPSKILQDIEKLRGNVRKHESTISLADVRIPEIEESMVNLENVDSICPICDNKLSGKKKETILSHKKSEISKLKSQRKKSHDLISGLTDKIDQYELMLEDSRKLQAKLEAMGDIEQQMKFAKDALKVLESETAEYSNEYKMLEKTVAMINTQMDSVRKKAEKLRLVVGKRDQLTEKMKKIIELQQEITRLNQQKSMYKGYSQAELERLENERASAAAILSSTEARIASMNMVIAQKQTQIEEVEKRIKTIELHKKELVKLKTLHSNLSILQSALAETQSQLRKNFIAAVNQAMHNIWQDLYPYKDFYSCRLNIDGGDYVLELRDSTGWVPADGLASGGERAMACLALRIAFALVLAPQLRWLVLDEPTHNLDARAVEDLGSVLRERITEFVDQVFLITHDPALEGAVSGYLYKLEREKEKNGETRISKMAGPETF